MKSRSGEEERNGTMIHVKFSIVVVCLILLVFLLSTVFFPQKDKLIYQDEQVTITRKSNVVRVFDSVSPTEYKYTLYRVKHQNTQQAKTITKTDYFTVKTDSKQLIIQLPGKTIYIVPKYRKGAEA